MWEEFKTAMATLKAAPSGWVDGIKESSTDAAQWLWVTLLGDFAEEGEQSTAQVVTGTLVSMVPFVDQLCDVRDLVANCKKIHKEPNNNWHWFALCLTLIGLFPTLGSLVKGCVKILVAGARREILKGVKSSAGVYQVLEPALEQGIKTLNDFMNTAAVRKTLKALNIVSPYHWLSKQVSDLAKAVSVTKLVQVFDDLHASLKSLMELVVKWGGAAMQTKVGKLLQEVKGVRDQLNAKLANILQPLQSWLQQVARRLEIEGDMAFRARVNTTNVAKLPAKELEAFDKAKPAWVDKGIEDASNSALKAVPSEAAALIQKGYPRNLDKNTVKTFSGTITPTDYPAGTVLYRVVGPNNASRDNGAFWMSKADFDKLKSKDQWRRECAVWQSWNGNGEYVTYTVPPGTTLKGWSGKAATQKMKEAPKYSLEGGANQILLNPADLKKGSMGKRQSTNWGYDLGTPNNALVGVPVLTNNWRD